MLHLIDLAIDITASHLGSKGLLEFLKDQVDIDGLGLCDLLADEVFDEHEVVDFGRKHADLLWVDRVGS